MRISVEGVEGFERLMRGADLTPVQLSRGAVQGSLIHHDADGLAFTSGRIAGDMLLAGPLSQDRLTLTLAADLPPGSWLWQHDDVGPGTTALLRPGDDLRTLCRGGALFAALSLSRDDLEREAALSDRLLDLDRNGGAGMLPEPISAAMLPGLRLALEGLHRGARAPEQMAQLLLEPLVRIVSTEVRSLPGGSRRTRQRYRVLERARDLIHAHAEQPLSPRVIALACGTSTRTLRRAFQDRFGISPMRYVDLVRLHRIRTDLRLSGPERTVTDIAMHWGITEFGRFAGRYRACFGELPSQTRARAGVPVASKP